MRRGTTTLTRLGLLVTAVSVATALLGMIGPSRTLGADTLETDDTFIAEGEAASPAVAVGETSEPASSDSSAGLMEKAFEILEPFYFRWGPRWFDFDSTLDDRITPVSSDYSFDRRNVGIDLAVGYDFGPRFGVEAEIGGASLSPKPEEADAFLGGAMLLGVIPIARFGAHEFRLAGGLGMTMLYQKGPDFPERVYIGTAGQVGGRLRLQLQRHTRLSMGVDYTVQDTRWEILPGADDGDDEIRNVGGTAWIRGAFAGLEFCF